MILPLSMTYPYWLVALCAWREARGETLEAQRGVIWTILNRAKNPSWWGGDIASVVLMPLQFSSFNPGDPNATKFPHPLDATWNAILGLVTAPGADPTNGATHYHDSSVEPEWAKSMLKTAMLGRLTFYRVGARVAA